LIFISLLAKRLAGKSISDMTYVVSSGMLNSVSVESGCRNAWCVIVPLSITFILQRVFTKCASAVVVTLQGGSK